MYLPDNWVNRKPPTREFFHNIINTVYNDYLREMLIKQNEARNLVTSEANDGNSVGMS